MAARLYYEDISLQEEITPLTKVATTQVLVKWAGASGDFSPLHYDEHFAKEQGVDRLVVHGQLKRAWLVQMLTDWTGDPSSLKKLSCRFIGLDHPRHMKSAYAPRSGKTIRCRGKVIRKYIDMGHAYIECEVWIENGRGEKTTTGQATTVLPKRSAR